LFFCSSGRFLAYNYKREKQENAADHNAGIRYVESRPSFEAEQSVKLYADKINDALFPENTIDNVADAPANYACQSPALNGRELIGFEIIPHEKSQEANGNDHKKIKPELIRNIVSYAKGNGLVPDMPNNQKLVVKYIPDECTYAK